ncbi:hypothetical protein D3C76_1815760 [compost metagenome]
MAMPEPVMVPISADDTTATFAGPPSLWPNRPMAKSVNSLIMPAFSRKAPNRMNRKIYVADT